MINAKNEAKRKLMETNNDRRNEVYVAFLDTVSELEVENTKMYDEEYFKRLIHLLNKVLLYSAKKLRKIIKEFRSLLYRNKAEYDRECKKLGLDNRGEYIAEYSSEYNEHIEASKRHYEKQLSDLKKSFSEKIDIVVVIQTITDEMCEELIKG